MIYIINVEFDKDFPKKTEDQKMKVILNDLWKITRTATI